MNLYLFLFQEPAAGGAGSLIWTILPFVFIFAIFYFLVIVPQKKQKQQLQDMIASLKINDEVVTNGGVIGKIKEVRENSYIIQSAEKTLIEIGKSAIVGKKPEETKS